MTIEVADDRARLRKSVYALIIAVGAATMIGRICAINSVDKSGLEKFRVSQHVSQMRKQLQQKGLSPEEIDAKVADKMDAIKARYAYQRPFLSGNDRSRWCTIRSLVEHGTYAINDVIAERGWDTIDMVQHLDDQGQPRLYSSKPTLLPTLIAGEYWVVHKLTGKTLGTHPFALGRFMLVTINVLGLVAAFCVLARAVERYGATDWGRLFVIAAAVFGTMLTTFAVTLNNHVIAAISSIFAVHASMRIWYDGERRWYYFAVAGFAAAFTAANDLPALSLFGLLSVALLWKAPLRTVLAYAPAAAVVACGVFGTQYLAHRSFRPAYAHRGPGKLLATIDHGAKQAFDNQSLPEDVRRQLIREGIPLTADATVEVKASISQTRQDSGWVILDGHLKYPVLPGERGLQVHAWDNWYDYMYRRHPKDKLRKSYWSSHDSRAKIDRGEPCVGTYALHSLVGHHGIFSLTPIWLLSVVGIVIMCVRPIKRPALATMIGSLSVICLVFYILLRPAEDRNYGGTSSGFRWMFWFAPLWLVAMLPAVDAASSKRYWRWTAIALLVISAASAAYPVWNPWRHPWFWNLMEYLGWIDGG